MEATTEPVEATSAGDTITENDIADDDIISTMMARMSAHVAAESGESESAPASDEPPAEESAKEEPAAEAKTPAPEPEPEPEPEKPEPADKRLELRYGQALEQVKDLTAKTVAFKQELGTTKAELARLAKLGKENPLALAEELSGLKLHEIMDRAIKGEFDKPQHANLPPEVQAKIDRLAQFEQQETERRAAEQKAAEEKAAAEKAAAAREADQKRIAGYVETNAEVVPFCAALPFMPVTIVNEIYELQQSGAKVKPEEVVKKVNDEAREHVRSILTNTQILSLLASDKEVRDSIGKAFGGLVEQKSQSGKRPADAAVPKTASALPTTHEIPARVDSGGFASPEEERAESIRLLRQLKERGQLI